MGIFNLFNKTSEPPIPQEAPKTVLVVDDDPLFRQIYSDTLTKNGYQVTTATNGQEALDSVKVKKPDAILLDITMPVMNGMEFLEILWNNNLTEKLPVIVLTNAGDVQNMDKAKFYSSYKFFVKSTVSPQEILDTIREAIATTPQTTPPQPAAQ